VSGGILKIKCGFLRFRLLLNIGATDVSNSMDCSGSEYRFKISRDSSLVLVVCVLAFMGYIVFCSAIDWCSFCFRCLEGL